MSVWSESQQRDLAYMGAYELATLIRRRALSPVEALDALLERIEARNAGLNALIHLAPEEARARAVAAERELMSGAPLGPLHGVPTAIKDLVDFHPGWPTTFGGIRSLRDFTTQLSCTYDERMTKAGAVIVGKTNSSVMGFRGTCDNPLFGPTRNPFDPSLNSGGSSGGSAAAVADGLLPFAEGTDAGGSILIPAAWCGVVGYKASFGRVPFLGRPNAFGGTNPFIFEGVLARSVEDAALATSVLTGYDARDPFSLDGHVDFLGASRRSIDGLRIAYSPTFGVYPVEPAVAETVAAAVGAFREAGAVVEEHEPAIGIDQRELSDLWARLLAPFNRRAFEGLAELTGIDVLNDHRDDLPDEYLRWMDAAGTWSALDVLRDQELRTTVYDSVQAVFEHFDLLVTPTLTCMPVPNATDGNTLGPSRVAGVEVDPLIGWCMTYLINMTGHPSVSVPAGLVDGIPVGMQIIGRRHADEDVVAAAAAFERQRPWHEHYAICGERAID